MNPLGYKVSKYKLYMQCIANTSKCNKWTIHIIPYTGLISRSNIFANNAVKTCAWKKTLSFVLKLIMNCHTLVFVHMNTIDLRKKRSRIRRKCKIRKIISPRN